MCRTKSENSDNHILKQLVKQRFLEKCYSPIKSNSGNYTLSGDGETLNGFKKFLIKWKTKFTNLN